MREIGGITWYRVGDDAWIDSSFTEEDTEKTAGSAVSGTFKPVTLSVNRNGHDWLEAYNGNGVSVGGYILEGQTIAVDQWKIIDGRLFYRGYYTNPSTGKKSTIRWFLADDIQNVKTNSPNGAKEDWDAAYFDETALESAIRVPCGNYNDGRAEIRILRGKNGETYYVYCAQHGNADRNGYRYQILDLSKEENLEKTGIPLEDLRHVIDIAANGYWGVTDD